VQNALDTLKQRGDAVYVTPQNLIEFWNAATRPVQNNGFGITPLQAEQEVMRIESYFRTAEETPFIYPAWRQIVSSVGVSGAQVHDARLVAVMQVHGLTHLLTLNTRDFARYPGITVVPPQDVLGTPPAGQTPP